MAHPPLFSCYVCNLEATQLPGEKDYVRCVRCGEYFIIGGLRHSPPRDRQDAYILSGVLRQSSDAGNILTIERDNIDSYIQNARYPHDPLALMDELLLLVYKRSTTADQVVEYNSAHDCSLVYAKTPQEFGYVIGMLEKQGYLKEGTDKLHTTRLTVRGWEKIRELQRKRPEGSNDAFMAMPFGDPLLDDVYTKQIQPAIEQTGFHIKRVTEGQGAGLIDDQIRVRIRNSRFLIAELTRENRGVYWEAGFAEGLGKRVIYLCRVEPDGKLETHFDTSHLNTVTWHESNLDGAMVRLKATVRATFPAEAKMVDS